jgi:magnesium transporter
LYEPDEKLLREIQEEFGLHDLAIEDAHETHIFVGSRYLVSVRHGSLQSHVGLRARCEAPAFTA